jgi:hemerythrin-like domain-containing protein
MQEHSAILQMLDIIEAACRKLDAGTAVDSHDLRDMLGFIQLFADRCHHGKEEGHLFPALEAAGIPREHGPIGVMLHEHDLGRKYVRGMGESLQGLGSGDKKFAKLFVENARLYRNMLTQHIEKENSVLFPMADMRLSLQKQQELSAEFENFEEREIGKDKHEELHGLLKRLEAVYLS